MAKRGCRAILPYFWLLLGILVLCGIFGILFTAVSGSGSLRTQADPFHASLQDAALSGTAAESFHVLEQFEAQHPQLPMHDFGPVQVLKAKQKPKTAKTLQAVLDQGHVLHSYVTPDRQRVLYFVQRTAKEASHRWSQIDLVTVDPDTQQMTQAPISYAYGEQAETAAASTLLCGFLSNNVFLYATVSQTDPEWVYSLQRWDMTEQKATPVLELFRYAPGLSSPVAEASPLMYEAVLAPDQKHLLTRDRLNGTLIYNLTDGSKKPLLAGAGERGTEAQVEISTETGIALYTAQPFQPDTWWLDMQADVKRQPFANEPGMIDAGIDSSGGVAYYNFTYDRSPSNLLNGSGPDNHLLLSYGVQLLDLQGHALSRFSLPEGAKERLEFGGYSSAKKTVLLHKYTLAANKDGRMVKQTSGWLLGDMNTGAMTPLSRLTAPDSWDRNDVLFGQVTLDPVLASGEEQVFVNYADQTYFMCRWNTKQVVRYPEEDTILYADDSSKKVFISSFTRPDLVVAALNYKKYNWDNQAFLWINAHWISRYQDQPDGGKMYLFPIS